MTDIKRKFEAEDANWFAEGLARIKGLEWKKLGFEQKGNRKIK